jgi:hypothetical protein
MRSQYKKEAAGGIRAVSRREQQERARDSKSIWCERQRAPVAASLAQIASVAGYLSEACCSSTSAIRRGASSIIITAGQIGIPVEIPAM